jgi:hypothetical protein
MKKIYYTLLSLILFTPVIASAQLSHPTNSYGLANNPDANTIITDVINFFLTFLASLAILMIVVSGIMYMVSGGDLQKVVTAKKILSYSIVGLVVALVSYMIVYFISRSLGAA